MSFSRGPAFRCGSAQSAPPSGHMFSRYMVSPALICIGSPRMILWLAGPQRDGFHPTAKCCSFKAAGGSVASAVSQRHCCRLGSILARHRRKQLLWKSYLRRSAGLDHQSRLQPKLEPTLVDILQTSLLTSYFSWLQSTASIGFPDCRYLHHILNRVPFRIPTATHLDRDSGYTIASYVFC